MLLDTPVHAVRCESEAVSTHLSAEERWIAATPDTGSLRGAAVIVEFNGARRPMTIDITDGSGEREGACLLAVSPIAAPAPSIESDSPTVPGAEATPWEQYFLTEAGRDLALQANRDCQEVVLDAPTK